MGIISTAVKHAVKLGATPDQILELVQALEAEVNIFARGPNTPTDMGEEISQENQDVNPKNERESFSKQLTSNKLTGNKCARMARTRAVIYKPDPDFDRFWAVWPRKVAVGAARKAFGKAVQRATADEIVAAATKFAHSRRDEDKRFTPHASTWLNQDRWLDEPDKTETTAISGPKRTWAEIKADLIQTGSPPVERWTMGQKPSTQSSAPIAGNNGSIPPCSNPAAETPISSSCGPPLPGSATTEGTQSPPSVEPSTGTEPPSNTTLASLKNRGGTEDALVPGHGEAPKRGASSEESEMARIRYFLPALLRVDDPPQDQAQVSAEAVFDEILVCGYPWDEPEAFNL